MTSVLRAGVAGRQRLETVIEEVIPDAVPVEITVQADVGELRLITAQRARLNSRLELLQVRRQNAAAQRARLNSRLELLQVRWQHTTVHPKNRGISVFELVSARPGTVGALHGNDQARSKR